LRRGRTSRPLAPTNRLGDLVNAGHQIHGGHLHPSQNGIPRLDAVATAELGRVHADLFGELIHDLLDAPVNLGHAKAAHGAADGPVGVDAIGIPLDVGDAVGTGAGVTGRAGDVDPVIVVGPAAEIVLGLHRQ